MALSKWHVPLLVACNLLREEDPDVGPVIRVTLGVNDEADEAPRVEALGVHLAREHGLAGWAERRAGGVTVYLSRRPVGDVEHRRGEHSGRRSRPAFNEGATGR